jgi:hypothetical protein
MFLLIALFLHQELLVAEMFQEDLLVLAQMEFFQLFRALVAHAVV